MRRLYTGRGDLGETDLLGERVTKDDPRIDLMGELDETTSCLGLARSLMSSERLTGIVIDQAALHGLLKKVRDLGMPLLSVIQIDPKQANGPDANADTDHNYSTKETNT